MTDQTGRTENGHAEGDGYLLYHSIGQYPGKARDMAASLTAFAECWGAPNDEQWGYALGQRQRFIDLWSQLLKAPSACTDNDRERDLGAGGADHGAAARGS